jgi:hypothetical protein
MVGLFLGSIGIIGLLLGVTMIPVSIAWCLVKLFNLDIDTAWEPMIIVVLVLLVAALFVWATYQ